MSKLPESTFIRSWAALWSRVGGKEESLPQRLCHRKTTPSQARLQAHRDHRLCTGLDLARFHAHTFIYLLLFGIDINSASRRKFYTTLNYCTNTFGSLSNVCSVEEYQDRVSGHGVTSYNDIIDLVGDSATASTSGTKACGPKERNVSFELGGGNGNGERHSGVSGFTKSEWKNGCDSTSNRISIFKSR